jgi:hypothetical protein
MRIEKAFRGISKRLALHYLEGLGARPVDADGTPVDGAGETTEAAERVDRAVAQGWAVTVGTETVAIGPTLEVTELVMVFEGDESVLEDVVEDFTWKSRRAGG